MLSFFLSVFMFHHAIFVVVMPALFLYLFWLCVIGFLTSESDLD